MGKRKKTDIVQFKVRLRESLRKQLEDAAHAKDMSLNSEIVSRLEQSFVQASLQDLIAEGRKDQNRFFRYIAQLDEIRTKTKDERIKETLWLMQEAWLKLAEQKMKGELPHLDLSDLSPRASASTAPSLLDSLASGLSDLAPPAPDEIDEERPARLRALADELRKNAERNDARGAHDLGAEPREWDTRARSVPPRSLSDQEVARATVRSRLAREPNDETNERRQALLRATPEGFRRNAKRHEARGAHDKAAEAREWADELERDARALTQGQAPQQPRSVSDQEPELPKPRQVPSQSKGGQ